MSSPRLVLYGPPGAGKGTQAGRLALHCGVRSYATGDILRAEIDSGSALGRRVEATLVSGELVDDATMFGVLERILEADCGFLLDGFPRTVVQARGLEDRLRDQGGVTRALVLEVSEAELWGRLQSRVTGGAQRSDDTEETFARRQEIYRASSSELLACYEAWGKLERIDGEGSEDEVFQRMVTALDGVEYETVKATRSE